MTLIREFKPHDTDAIAALIVTIQHDEFGVDITRAAQPDLDNIAHFYQQGTGNFWVAENNGDIVGTIALLDIGEQQVALRKMFVAPAFRGREHGVAQGLLQTLIHWAQSKSVRQIFLGTTAQFLAAHRFYEKNEFSEISKNDLPSRFPIMAIDSKFYRRDL